MAADRRCQHCASDTPGRHYRDLCPGDASLRPLRFLVLQPDGPAYTRVDWPELEGDAERKR